MINIESFKPHGLWYHFDNIRKIPRCSGNERAVVEYVAGVAKSNGWNYFVDSIGNILVKVPATDGRKSLEPVILQNHLDMVCESDSNIKHNFLADPILLKTKENWLMAEGTSLGADNGIGVSTALALAEDTTLLHPPLELLFTVEEEIGLIGASKLSFDNLKGTRLINLDSEELSSIFIGCAGGADSIIELPLKKLQIKDNSLNNAIKISVSGLSGGHSGIDINKNRSNAIKVLSELLAEPIEKGCNIVSINGGSKRNAIPRDATAIIYLGENDLNTILDLVRYLSDKLQKKYNVHEPNLTFFIENMSVSDSYCLTNELSNNVIHLLKELPTGVFSMSADVLDLVETSNNLATVKTTENTLIIGLSSRSSDTVLIDEQLINIGNIAQKYNAKVTNKDSYPSWKPNLQSPLLSVVKQTYSDIFKKEPIVTAIHAGLECGIIGNKYPNLDMISIGPIIESPHSPMERVNIASVLDFWNFLVKILERLQ